MPEKNNGDEGVRLPDPIQGEFVLQTVSGRLIPGEYKGNNPERVIVLSHGFGVDREARGMFREISNMLEEDAVVVLFDYSEVDREKGETRTPSLSVQVKLLGKVIEHVREKFSPSEVDLIAHSQGCVTAGLLSPDDINKVILLSSPVSPSYERMKEYFSAREETVINEQGESIIKRSDGSVTLLQPDFWGDLEVDPSLLYQELATKTEITLVVAEQDQVITGQDFSTIEGTQEIKVVKIPGNHDFDNTKEAREGLLNTVLQELN